jgi:hypothetical protein
LKSVATRRLERKGAIVAWARQSPRVERPSKEFEMIDDAETFERLEQPAASEMAARTRPLAGPARARPRIDPYRLFAR